MGEPRTFKKLTMKRHRFINLLGAAAAWPLAARGRSGAVRRIGVPMSFVESDPAAQERATAFRQSLTELGWSEGRNLKIEWHWRRRYRPGARIGRRTGAADAWCHR